MSNPVAQHGLSAFPALLYTGTLLTHVNQVVSIAVGVAALVYYYLAIRKLRQDLKEPERKDVPPSDQSHPR